MTRGFFAGSLRAHLQRVFIFSFLLMSAASFAGVWGLAVRARDRDEASHFSGLAQVLAELVRHPLEISDYSDAQRMLSFISHEPGIIPAILTEEGDVLLGDYGQSESSGLSKLRLRSKLSCLEAAALQGESHRMFCSEIFGIRGGISTTRERLGLSLVMVGSRSRLFPFRELFLIFGIMLATLVILSWAIRSYFTTSIVEPLERLRAWVAAKKTDPLAPSSGIERRFSVMELDDLRTAFEDLSEAVRRESNRRQTIERELARQDLARQVAHDIRSPLAALEVVSGDVSQLPEDKRILIRAAVGRIRDIANSLLSRYRARAAGIDLDGASPLLLSSLVDAVVSEKRQQFKECGGKIELRLEPTAYGLFAVVQSVEFKRIVSNLVNNAVEASDGSSGTVTVSLSAEAGSAVIGVRDEGKGIAPEVLAKIGRRGETHGKAGGSGLGLYHAYTSAEAWGGSVKISSEVGRGTFVSLVLPQVSGPEWFVSECTLIPGHTVVILDDDASIHLVWQTRFDALDAARRGVDRVHLSAPDEIRTWVRDNPARAASARFLLDYELAGHDDTGLTLAKELGLGERAILVTSRYDEPGILAACRELGVRMIPKVLARLVPIRIQSAQTWDAILIDDDDLARATWRMAASKRGKRLRVFATAAEFFMEAGSLDRATPVYVDAELGQGVDGAVESARMRQLGFEEIYLATGHDPARYVGLSQLKGVVGKEPPWA